MVHQFKYTILMALVGMVGCASPSKVPSIDSDTLPKVTFQRLEPRTLNVQVNNHRDINKSKGNGKDAEQSVHKALSVYFEKHGIKISDKSKNKLVYDVRDYEGPLGSKEACIKLHGYLTLVNSQQMANEASACYTLKNLLFGFTMGSDIDKAYEQALSFSLDQFDKNLR